MLSRAHVKRYQFGIASREIDSCAKQALHFYVLYLTINNDFHLGIRFGEDLFHFALLMKVCYSYYII